jgi:curved DNA-binding protein CbpA
MFSCRPQVDKAATLRKIRIAFKDKAVASHPDKNPGDAQAEVKMQELNEAMTVLGDPDSRNAYDHGGMQAVAAKATPAHTVSHKGSQNMEFYESFGLFDADPQIEVIDYHSWEASHYSTDAWVVLFYSPEGGDCQDLASDWRKVGSALHGAFHVGAVNCEQDYPVCKGLGVTTLPAVLLFSKGTPRNAQTPVTFGTS